MLIPPADAAALNGPPLPPAALTAQAMSLEAILSLPKEVLDTLPAELSAQLGEIRAAAAEEANRQAEERQAQRQSFGHRVLSLYADRRGQRSQLEMRWRNDLLLYNSQYDAATLNYFKSRAYGSTAFVPLARRVCNIVEARWADLVYPTGDRNFSITASPVPEGIELEALIANAPAPTAADPGSPPLTKISAAIKELRHEAKLRADNMQRAVDDQLKEANAASVGRRVIRDAVVYGTGVMKGPTVLGRVKKVWDTGNGKSELKVIEDTAPTVQYVSHWNFFPDLSTTVVAECTPIELHWLSAVQLADIAKIEGFDKDAIRRVLRAGPTSHQDPNRDYVREASQTQGVDEKAFEVLEYHGPATPEELRAMGVDVPQAPDGEDDPLEIFEAVVFVATTGEVLKATINPMGKGDHPYSVLNWQEDPGSIFGFGLPFEVADLCAVANSAFRAAIDNAGLTAGPQIVVSQGIRPRNGQWVIEPNKLWEATEPNFDVRQAFGFFTIDSQVEKLLALFNLCKQMVEEISGSQLAMMGADAPSYMETARGASMAHNAANVWMRRAVRLFDDNLTSPLVGRFVDWNMEHNPDPSIKGDLTVIARGTSALLEAETQSTRVASFVELAREVPMKFRNRVAQLREMARGMRLDVVDILPSDEEVNAMGEQIDSAAAPPNSEMERLRIREIEIKDRAEERAQDWATERLQHERFFAGLASKEQITIAQAREKYAFDRERLAADTQKFNAELFVKQQMGTGI